MEITFESNGTLLIDNARIVFRNFSGEAGKYNRAGDRSFALVIDDPRIFDELVERGWNPRAKDVDDETTYIHLPVKVKFNDFGPTVYLKSGKAMRKLNEDNVDCLDRIDIASVDLNIRPYDWEMNGRTGRSAYLDSIWVTQRVDRFAARFEHAGVSEDDTPF